MIIEHKFYSKMYSVIKKIILKYHSSLYTLEELVK